MLDKDPKKIASVVLHRAFGGGKMTAKSNFPSPRSGNQYPSSVFGNPGANSNFSEPRQSVQHMAEGGEVEEGKLVAAEEMLSAMQDRDAKKFAMALHNFIMQCYWEGEAQEESVEAEVE